MNKKGTGREIIPQKQRKYFDILILLIVMLLFCIIVLCMVEQYKLRSSEYIQENNFVIQKYASGKNLSHTQKQEDISQDIELEETFYFSGSGAQDILFEGMDDEERQEYEKNKKELDDISGSYDVLFDDYNVEEILIDTP